MNTKGLYRKNLLSLRELDSKEVFGNGKSEFVAIMVEDLFRHAKYSVKVFDHDLDPEVFENDRVIRQVEVAYNRGVYMEVVTQSKPDSGKFLEYIDLRVSDNDKVNSLKLNFVVVDNKSFRLFDREAGQGQASFNGKKTARKLTESFDKIYDKLSKNS